LGLSPLTCCTLSALKDATMTHHLKINWNLLAFLVTLVARIYSLFKRTQKMQQPEFIPPAVQSKLDELKAHNIAANTNGVQKISIVPITAITKGDQTMSPFKSILSGIGKVLEKVFTIGISTAEAAKPIIDLFFPGVAPLYNLTVAAVADAETKSIAAGKQGNSGPQKLALVVEAIEDDFNAYAKASGWTLPPTAQHIEAWVNAVVATLNVIPAPEPPSPATV
jgi:hypothetical protein